MRIWLSGAHPRLRGADANQSSARLRASGSSPLTRGGLIVGVPFCGGGGLIPAYAGRTNFDDISLRCLKAHPRLRGADENNGLLTMAYHGSSPLTRGGHGSKPTREPPSGLIPAYAGRTGVFRVGVFGHRAHPRLRGADLRGLKVLTRLSGSSPLTRGGLHLRHPGRIHLRLIPAYAGRTYFDLVAQVPQGAHPRLRGADLMMMVCGSAL